MVSADAVEAATYNIKDWTKNNKSSLSDAISGFLSTIDEPVVEPVHYIATWLGLSKATDTHEKKKQPSHNIFKEPSLQPVVEFNKQITQNIKRNISRNVENPYNITVHKTSVDVVPTATKYDNEARTMANQLASAIIKTGNAAKVVKTAKGYTVVVTKKSDTSSPTDSVDWTKLLRMIMIEQEAENEAKSKTTAQAGIFNNKNLLYIALLVIAAIAIIYYVIE